MTTHRTYPPVASSEAAAYDARDHSDCTPEDLEPAEWETDPALLAELDAEMQQQGEEWERLTGPWVAVGGMDCEEIPF